MPIEELNNYIEQCLKLGKLKQEIVSNLLNGGWNNDQIEESFSFVKEKQKMSEIKPLGVDEIKPEPKLEIKTEIRTEANPQPQLKSKLISEPELKLEPKPEIELVSAPNTKYLEGPEIKPEPKLQPESKPEIENSKPSLEAKADLFINKNKPLEVVEKTGSPLPWETASSKNGFKKILIPIILFIILLVLGGAGIYAYLQKIGPFSMATYSEENFSSGLLTKFAKIKSSSYTFSGAVNVVPRDQDAVPFKMKELGNEQELKQKYYNDVRQADNIEKILQKLSYYYNNNTSAKGDKTEIYPINLKTLVAFKNQSSYYSNLLTLNDIIDPVTKTEYEYKTTENGKNFVLAINFETNYPIKEIKTGYSYDATKTIIEGNKVSFTKDSSRYFYMSSEPRKPFLVEASESMEYVPADFNAKASFMISYETKLDATPDYSLNFDAEGDFGDLTYKINADALKKTTDYYFRINNFPGIFLSFLGEGFGSIKGKWVKISPDSTSEHSEEYRKGIEKIEEAYKENKEKISNLIKKIVTIADQEKLVVFKNKPKSEKIDGRDLIRYDLKLRKEAFLPFYIKLDEELKKDSELSTYWTGVDESLLEYLKSEEFSQAFDYIDQNNSFTLWTDKQGFPAILQNTMRVVPADNIIQLKDKQVNVTFKVLIDNINEPLEIQTPTESITIEELFKSLEGGLTYTTSSSARDARIKADMDQIRVIANIFKTNNNNYNNTGTPVKLTDCTSVAKTFTAETDYQSLCKDMSTQGAGAWLINIKSGSTVPAYCVAKKLNADSIWCIDSTGYTGAVLSMDICGSSSFSCSK